MSLGVNIALTILFIITMILIIGILVVRLNKREEDFLDNPILINFISNYSNGRVIGIEKSNIAGKDGRRIIEFSPKDISFNKDTKEEIKDEKIIVERNKLITLPKGRWSQYKNMDIAIPSKAEDFPEPLKESLLGKALMLATEMINADNTELMAVREGSNRKTNIIKRSGDGEISREHLNSVEEIVKDMAKMAMEIKKKDIPASNYPPVTNSFNDFNR